MRWFLFDEFEIVTTERSLRQIFRRRRWSRKAIQWRAKQQSLTLRLDWMVRIKDYQKEQFVFLDESACNARTMDRKVGWSEVGVPCKGVQPLKREKRYSLLPAYTVDGYLPGYLIHQGSVTKDMFIKWLKDDVLPLCQPYPLPRSVLCMDNASIHRSRVRSSCCQKKH